MKFTAAGDAIIQRRIQKDFDGFAELAPFIEKSDASSLKSYLENVREKRISMSRIEVKV